MARIHDARKQWKLSPMDLKARSRWVEYSKARDAMLARTNSGHAPWYLVDANVKRLRPPERHQPPAQPDPL